MDDLAYSVDQLRRTVAEAGKVDLDDVTTVLHEIDEKLESISGSLFTIAEVMKERWDAENAPSEPVVLEEPFFAPGGVPKDKSKRTLKRKGT